MFVGVLVAVAPICGILPAAEPASSPATLPSAASQQALGFAKTWLSDFHDGRGSRAIKQSLDREGMLRRIFTTQYDSLPPDQRQQIADRLLAVACIMYDNSLAKQAMAHSQFDSFTVRPGAGDGEYAVSYRVTFPNYVRNTEELVLWRADDSSDWQVRDLINNGTSLVQKLARDYASDTEKPRPDAYLTKLQTTMTEQHRKDVAILEVPTPSAPPESRRNRD